MAIITRSNGGAYLNRCTTCNKQWVSAKDDGEPEASQHKH
jgi:hypothetical protein